jgi:hypothetical protein
MLVHLNLIEARSKIITISFDLINGNNYTLTFNNTTKFWRSSHNGITAPSHRGNAVPCAMCPAHRLLKAATWTGYFLAGSKVVGLTIVLKILNYNILDGYAYRNNFIPISDKSVHCAAKITSQNKLS